jgi:predicted O-linked N-acetylglucosamine transferase (SPINDLY family)
MTERVRNSSELFYHIPDNFESICRQIVKDGLHVLIFPDIGMSPKTTMLAALRLAPVQCMAWGHPVTSGLPSVDYFLSSELMEPSGAQRYYSERLVLLPGIGICIDKRPIPRPLMVKGRANWGIPEDATVYLCCQSLFKYLPRNDQILPAIARSVPKAKFVFISSKDVPCNRFWTRLQCAFSTVGLGVDDYCLMLPQLNYFDYCNLNIISDVFLDSVGWSGGMTSLDAIVTLPGGFMRSRHSYAMLTQLGITETIASSEANYIDIAVRLGLDSTWRKALVQKIADNCEKLYSDLRNVRALERLLEGVIAAQLSGRTPDQNHKRQRSN